MMMNENSKYITFEEYQGRQETFNQNYCGDKKINDKNNHSEV